MPTDDGTPDLPHRRKRLPAADIRDKMLTAAREIVSRTGVTVSVEDLSLEQVIQHAGVPRSSVYRIWPYKEDFIDDLLCHIAGPDWLGATVFDEKTIEIAAQVVMDNQHRLDTAGGRRDVLREAIRQGVQRNLNAVTESRERQIFTALVATIRSPRGDDAWQRIQAALEQTEVNLLGRMSEFYSGIATVLGFRPRKPEYTFRHIACAGASLIDGLALRSRVALETKDNPIAAGIRDPQWTLAEVINNPLPGPGLDGQTVDWSLAAVAFLGLVDTFFEPDPNFRSPPGIAAEASQHRDGEKA